jgi:hypothetical protein
MANGRRSRRIQDGFGHFASDFSILCSPDHVVAAMPQLEKNMLSGAREDVRAAGF